MSCADWVSPVAFQSFVGSEHKKAIKCIHINCQSAKNKTDELDSFFSSITLKFDFNMLSETWYDQVSTPWVLPGYLCFTKSISASRGGGVALLAKENCNTSVIEQYSCISSDYEVISVLCVKTVYSVFYRPPNGNFERLFSFLEQFFQYVHDNQYNAIWGGDYNINMLADTAVKRSFEILLKSHGYFNVIMAQLATLALVLTFLLRTSL